MDITRRKFIKGSAIIGAGIVLPSYLFTKSGLFAGVGNRKVRQMLNAERVNVGTLPVMRAFAGDHTDYVSPYVLFDEFGPVEVTPGANPLRVDAHPHAGVSPTTYFLHGSGHHKDSLNYDFQVNTGEYMMFNSGRGAIHMEESGKELKENGGTIHGFQIWLNTPARYKHDAPTTVVFRGEDMPTIVNEKLTGRVVLGELMGYKSKIETLSPAFYYYLNLKPGAKIDIPVESHHNAFIYGVSGTVELEGQVALKPKHLALTERGENNITLFAAEGAEVFVLGGEPLNEVVFSYGPFVMNNEAQIRQCIADYQAGKMGDPAKVN